MQNSPPHLEILQWQNLENIPSASGIAKFGQDYFVIGDDSPYLFRIDKNFDLISKTLIHSKEKMIGSTIPKIGKADFEAMEMVSDDELLIFGSGSKSPERDVCIFVEIGEEVKHEEYPISQFYNYLKSLEIMKNHELDIEALAFSGEQLHLFNRGRNIIFSFSYLEFRNYCKTGGNFPIPKTQLFSLLKIYGLEAGFSGATSFTGFPYFIFTAAVEDAPNAYDDGKILGSFLGILKFENGKFGDDFLVIKIPDPGFPLKVESVVIDKVISSNEMDLILVTDHDGKPSQILKMRITNWNIFS